MMQNESTKRNTALLHLSRWIFGNIVVNFIKDLKQPILINWIIWFC